MALEQFKSRGRGGGADEPLISLRQSDSIGINSAAMEEWFEDATHVNLYYDDENNIIGIEPLEAHGEHSYKINKTENSGSVTPSAFFNQHSLHHDITTRYAAEWDEDEGMVLVNLNDEKGTYGTPGNEETEEDDGK